MKLKLAPLVAALTLTSAIACTTTGSGSRPRSPAVVDKGLAKPGDKSPADTSANASTSPGATPPTGNELENTGETTVRTPSMDEQLAFVKTHSSPSSEWGEPERAFVTTLPMSPKAGGVTEAALVLGLVKTVLHPRHLDAVTYKETDLASGDEADAGHALSLEQLCRDHGVNLPDALVENPLLRGFGIAKQVHRALESGGGSPDFETEIMIALKREAGLWSELGNALAAPEATGATDAADTVIDDMPPNPADLRGGDALLGEAQALADRGNFLAAIRKASMIAATSPMHAMAQEKIRDFSKTAVQELRRKAANAFQSAAPVADSRTKVSYLKQAKTYLEEAIKHYPEAPQLPTVRDNLRAISRDLERLESKTGQGH